MDFTGFAKERNDCHVAEDSFLLWRLNGASTFAPCTFEKWGKNIIAHIIVWEGEMLVSYDNEDYLMTEGCFATFIDKRQLKLLSVSPFTKAYVMVLVDAYVDELLKNNPPMPFSYLIKVRERPLTVMDKKGLNVFIRRMDNIWETCADVGHLFREKMIRYSIWMFFMDVANCHIKEESGEGKKESGNDRAMCLFREFMRMLPQNVANERFTGYYADRLCVTPQYLNRIVKAVSGRTVSGWINFYLVGEITKRLENTDDMIQKIATDLHFPDQATMTKFFKRETGLSPTEYRKTEL
ncbi:MAG: helix-turn-helix domain-containing protein [Prevotella sp.]